MWYRFLSLLVVLASLSLVTSSYAANDNDVTGNLSPAAARALASNDYEQVALALFSAQTPADIAALTPAFERLRAQKMTPLGLRNPQGALSDWTLAGALFLKITNDAKLSNRLSSTYYNRLLKGDVLLRRTGLQGCKLIVIVPLCQFWAFMYEHSGIYYGKRFGQDLSVYESTNDGGVQFMPLKTWKDRSLYVGIHRSAVDVYRIAAIFEQLVNKYGYRGQTPYNFNLANKYTDKALYCSQLVWKFYLMLGVDVDSNDPMYAAWLRLMYGNTIGNYISANAVAPDEVGLTSKLFRVAAGWNN
ncbi:MAG: hypothetical protein EBS29_09860 [Chloroflexia bacterium]|nr:hypothetical protein [Chloroflexia bacterium]